MNREEVDEGLREKFHEAAAGNGICESTDTALFKHWPPCHRAFFRTVRVYKRTVHCPLMTAQ
jgi:hypothetical protein